MVSPGWYTVPGSAEVRWRDEQHWTAYRIAKGKPGADWYATEPPLIGYAFGAVFLGLGAAQVALALLGGISPFNSLVMLLLGVFWLSAGIAGSVVRRKPAPEIGPVAPVFVQPVPGQTEGADAGWYPVSARTERWWSGTRWGSYVREADRVRPTFGGPRTYRAMRIMALVMFGIGVLALTGGIVLQLVDADAPGWLGWPLAVGGAVLALAGAVVFLAIGLRRAALLIPDQPPRLLQADPS